MKAMTFTLMLTVITASVAGVSANANDRAIMTVDDIVSITEFSGLGVCPSEPLVAVRIDTPIPAENRISHGWVIFDVLSGEVRSNVSAGASLNTSGYYDRVSPIWDLNCEWIYYRSRQNAQIQVWRLNSIDGHLQQVTNDEADVLSFSLFNFGLSLVYETGASRRDILEAEAREYREGVLFDENVYPWHDLFRTKPVAGRWSTVKRWGVREAGHLLSREPRKYKVLRIGDSESRPAKEAEISLLKEDVENRVTENGELVKISPSAEHTAVSRPIKFNVGGRPIAFSLAYSRRHKRGTEVLECRHEPCTAEHLKPLHWSDGDRHIYFIAEQVRGAAGIYAWTPASGAIHTVLETDGVLGSLGSADRYRSRPCPILGDYAICTYSDHKTPPKLVKVSLTTGSQEILYEPNHRLRKRFNLRTERIHWEDGFNRDTQGVLVYPYGFEEGIRYPLVITTYTCRGFLTGGLADGGPEYVLAEHGIVVLCIDFNFDTPPLEETEEYSLGPARYVAALSEYESAIDMLVTKGVVDQTRVGISGISFSAQSISYALTRSSIFDVASLRSVGVWEPENEIFFHPKSNLWKASARINNAGEDSHDPQDVFDDIAISRRADQVDIPILVQASDGEYLGSLPAFMALSQLRKPIEMHVFPDETHQLHQPIHRLVNFERNLDWFRFWLQDHEDPAPEKAEQYARWRKMRDEQCARSDLELPSYCPAN